MLNRVKSGKTIDSADTVIYTIKDIKRIFQLGDSKAYALLSSPGFPSFKMNKRYCVSKKDLEEWIARNIGKTFYY